MPIQLSNAEILHLNWFSSFFCGESADGANTVRVREIRKSERIRHFPLILNFCVNSSSYVVSSR